MKRYTGERVEKKLSISSKQTTAVQWLFASLLINAACIKPGMFRVGSQLADLPDWYYF